MYQTAPTDPREVAEDGRGPDGARSVLRRLPIWLTPAAVLALSLLAFLALADGVREQADLSAYDPAITADAMGVRNLVLTGFARLFTFLGNVGTVAVLALGLIVWIVWRHRDWRPAAVVAGAVGLGAVLTVVLKLVFGRVRPPAADQLGAFDPEFAFPSGHTLNATVLYGLIAIVIIMGARRRAVRVAAVVGWFGLSLAVAVSRVYLGYHWATDVLAGFVIGVAVLSLAVLAGMALGVGRSGEGPA